MYWQWIEEAIQKTNVSACWFTITSRSLQPSKKFAIEVKKLVDHHKMWTVELWTMCLFWACVWCTGIQFINVYLHLKYTMNTALNHQKNLHLYWPKISMCHAFKTVLYNLNRSNKQTLNRSNKHGFILISLVFKSIFVKYHWIYGFWRKVLFNMIPLVSPLRGFCSNWPVYIREVEMESRETWMH